MIPYSLPKQVRYTAYFATFFLAVSAQGFVSNSFTFFGAQQITAAGIGALLFFLFENYLWKLPGRIGIPISPDFSGNWRGYITWRKSFQTLSNDKDHYSINEEQFIPISIEIEQTFTEISINFKTYNPSLNKLRPGILAEEASECVAAAVDMGSRTRPKLLYAFKWKIPGSSDLDGFSDLVMSGSDGSSFLHGGYFSNRQRVAEIEMKRARHPKNIFLRGKIQMLPDHSNAKYVGVSIPREVVSGFIHRLEHFVGKTKYSALALERMKRDGPDYHLTLLSPPEYAKLSEQQREKLTTFLGRTIWIECEDLGKVQAGPNESYYVLTDCSFGQMLRRAIDCEPKQFHITLGFLGSDNHEWAKDRSTRIRMLLPWFLRPSQFRTSSRAPAKADTNLSQ